MSPQLRLPGWDPPNQVQPLADRKTPVFWVRRVRIVRELKPGEDAIVRDVLLRTGLNVVWTPALLSEENGLFKNGVSGHTAGKTMFCRLIRHVLGEGGLLAESTRRRLRAAFPKGWVLGEVIVRDELWTVARPFAVGAHPFCVQGRSIESATDHSPHLSYQSFLEAIGAAVAADLSASRFPGDGTPIVWTHVLPWLSRDQECRYADFLEWRHSSTNSEAPSLDVDERQFVVRALLGLISDEERAEQEKNAHLLEVKAKASARVPLLLHQADVDHRRVIVALGVELAAPSSPLFGSEAREEVARRFVDLDRRKAELSQTDRRTELQSAFQEVVAREAHAERDCGAVADELALERRSLAELTGGGQSDLLEALPPPREYCGVRMIIAREHGCPLAASRPVALSERRGDRAAADEIAERRALVSRLEAILATEQNKLAAARAAVRDARMALMKASTVFEEARGRIINERAQLAQVDRMIAHAEETAAEATAQSERLRETERAILDSYARQKQIREAQHDTVDRFSASFDYVVRAFLGPPAPIICETTSRVRLV